MRRRISKERPALLGLVFFFVLVFGMARADERSAPAADVYNRAVRLYEKGNWDQAKEYFHQYLAEYSDTPLYITCLYYLGYCYQQLGNVPEAVSIYHKVIDEAHEGDAFWGEMAEHRIMEMGETSKDRKPD